MEIHRVTDAHDLAAASRLIQEYVEALGAECCGLREFQTDLNDLVGVYFPPGGSLLVAREEEEFAGCVALKFSEDSVCEMKRLYVRLALRGRGVGRALVNAILSEARNLGYRRMRLDTVPAMREAVSLYHSFGFRPVAPFREPPDPASIFLELELD